MHELVFDGDLDGNKHQRCAEVFNRLRDQYEQDGTQNKLSQLTVSMFTHPGSFSCLSANAAEARALLKPLLELCKALDSGSDRDMHRVMALEHLVQMYEIFQRADLVLTDAEADGAMAAYQTYLVHYNELLQLSLDRKERNYNLVFKHHHMCHIVDHARFIHPRYIWCYEFEDLFD